MGNFQNFGVLLNNAKNTHSLSQHRNNNMVNGGPVGKSSGIHFGGSSLSTNFNDVANWTDFAFDEDTWDVTNKFVGG